jgi:hypothetical protein
MFRNSKQHPRPLADARKRLKRQRLLKKSVPGSLKLAPPSWRKNSRSFI